jgi:hypothetical protein
VHGSVHLMDTAGSHVQAALSVERWHLQRYGSPSGAHTMHLIISWHLLPESDVAHGVSSASALPCSDSKRLLESGLRTGVRLRDKTLYDRSFRTLDITHSILSRDVVDWCERMTIPIFYRYKVSWESQKKPVWHGRLWALLTPRIPSRRTRVAQSP